MRQRFGRRSSASRQLHLLHEPLLSAIHGQHITRTGIEAASLYGAQTKPGSGQTVLPTHTKASSVQLMLSANKGMVRVVFTVGTRA